MAEYAAPANAASLLSIIKEPEVKANSMCRGVVDELIYPFATPGTANLFLVPLGLPSSI